MKVLNDGGRCNSFPHRLGNESTSIGVIRQFGMSSDLYLLLLLSVSHSFDLSSAQLKIGGARDGYEHVALIDLLKTIQPSVWFAELTKKWVLSKL